MNPKYKTNCYIGFTVDPCRRIRQHNGEIVGGALKTEKKRPWEMALVVYGFPTKKLALSFEWTWQHPQESAKLRGVDWKSVFEKDGGPRSFFGNIRVLKEMLLVQPWSRLSLRICVQAQDVYEILQKEPSVKDPIRIELTTIDTIPISQPDPSQQDFDVPSSCVICFDKKLYTAEPVNWVICPYCGVFLHLRCMALQFISCSQHSSSALLPTKGVCPSCREDLLWRDLVEIKNQMFENIADDTENLG